MTVILVVHILVSIVLVGVVLLQRSEGGALGVGGGGGGGGGLMSGRGAAGALVRTTIIFGGIFFVTSLVLAWMARQEAEGARTYLPELETIEEQADVPAPADQVELPAAASEVPAVIGENSEKEVSDQPQADVESASPAEVPQPAQ